MEHYQDFVPILIDAHKPNDAVGLVNEGVDFFLSTAVFQHFPSKEYGITVTRLAYSMVKAHGIAIIQTRYDDGSAELRSKRRDYLSNAVAFTSYSIPEYWDIACNSGFEPLGVILSLKPCYAYYLLKKNTDE